MHHFAQNITVTRAAVIIVIISTPTVNGRLASPDAPVVVAAAKVVEALAAAVVTAEEALVAAVATALVAAAEALAVALPVRDAVRDATVVDVGGIVVGITQELPASQPNGQQLRTPEAVVVVALHSTLDAWHCRAARAKVWVTLLMQLSMPPGSLCV